MEKRLEEVVDFLEDKILKLLDSYKLLQAELAETQKTLQQQQSNNAAMNSELEKKETKHKINALIREIDMCIAQLS